MSHPSRLASALVAVALSLGLVVGTAGAGVATTTPAGRAGSWLERQLSNGLVHNNQYDVDDYGLTADTGLALAALGGHRAARRQIVGALSKHVDDYTRGGGTDVYAGPTAKLAVLARSAGRSPRKFGGVDLVAQLARTVSTKKPTVGRIQDKSQYGDYANVVGQALAVNALRAAGSGKAAAAERFLLLQQCKPGFFRLYFSDPGAADQSCAGAKKADRVPDTDATATAVLQLQAIKRPTKRVKAATRTAVQWLVRHQNGNGSFGGSKLTRAANSNSTGLGARALAGAGKCAAAKRAARWIVKLQRKNGAIAYDRTTFGSPITKSSQDQWRRATVDAGPALRYLHGC